MLAVADPAMSEPKLRAGLGYAKQSVSDTGASFHFNDP